MEHWAAYNRSAVTIGPVGARTSPSPVGVLLVRPVASVQRGGRQAGQARQVDTGNAADPGEGHQQGVARTAADHGAELAQVDGEPGDLADRAARAADDRRPRHLGAEDLDQQPADRIAVNRSVIKISVVKTSVVKRSVVKSSVVKSSVTKSSVTRVRAVRAVHGQLPFTGPVTVPSRRTARS